MLRKTRKWFYSKFGWNFFFGPTTLKVIFPHLPSKVRSHKAYICCWPFQRPLLTHSCAHCRYSGSTCPQSSCTRSPPCIWAYSWWPGTKGDSPKTLWGRRTDIQMFLASQICRQLTGLDRNDGKNRQQHSSSQNWSHDVDRDLWNALNEAENETKTQFM